MIVDDLRQWIDGVVTPWVAAQGLPGVPRYVLEEPPAGIEFDVACNLALLIAKPLKKSPRAVAQELQALFPKDQGLVGEITIAGPGFLNFQWTLPVLIREMQALLNDPLLYGRLPADAAKKVLIEFVSANPTGPLHVGHGRGAALGDSLALILQHLGHSVKREYYINDAGNQVQLLGQSLLARVKELQGLPFTLPEEGYVGDYVRDIARDYLQAHPNHAEDLDQAIAFALAQMQKAIEKDLLDFGVRFDDWFNESRLVRDGLVERYVALLKSRGFIEEADGALWFVAPGDDPEAKDKNRVIRRQDGRWTYFATDIAYHADKFDRGFDQLIDVWGADHHGYVPRVKGSMQALGYDSSKLHIVLNQLVALTRDGVPVSMSKRSGDFVMLRDVLNEVGRDACRFFFAMRGPNTAFEFDLELAKKHSNDNPVFYLQYAHARICSIFRQAAVPLDTTADLGLLKEKEERELMKRMAVFPQILRVCAEEDSPHPLANYLLLLCRQFHHFYDHHRVLGEDLGLTRARLRLLGATRQLLKVGMMLLGVSAPESM